MVLRAAASAAHSITVSAALKDAMVAIGVAESRITVLRNGVDLARFRCLERAALRSRLGLQQPTLLSAGNLIELKGHHLVIQALQALPGWQLVIAGKGALDAEAGRSHATQLAAGTDSASAPPSRCRQAVRAFGEKGSTAA